MQDKEQELYLIDINGSIDKIEFTGCQATLPAWECIKSDWMIDDPICTADVNPVIGCDDNTYGNSCLARAAGMTSWLDLSTEQTTYRVEAGAEIETPEGLISRPFYNPYLIAIDKGDIH